MPITKINSLGITNPVSFSAGTAGSPSITFSGDTNTGVFAPAADTIAFTEGGTESLRIDSSANLQFNSGYGSVATAFGCRAWVNFNGTGTPAIREDGNVTSITDNGLGDYTINFTTAMPDANFCATGCIDHTTAQNGGCVNIITVLAASVRVKTVNAATAFVDAVSCYVAVFR